MPRPPQKLNKTDARFNHKQMRPAQGAELKKIKAENPKKGKKKEENRRKTLATAAAASGENNAVAFPLPLDSGQ